MGKTLEAVATSLVWIFLLGLFGSALVIVLTTIEDVRVLLEKDDTPQPPEAISLRGN